MIYLDNSATTAVCKEAADAVYGMLTENFGNPSSTHNMGARAAKTLDAARAAAAQAVGCKKEEIFFTPGGTYADNTAVFGTVRKLGKRGKRIVTSSVEHPAVEECMKRLEAEGYDVVRLSAGSDGRISAEEAEQAIDKNTILVSVMSVNNEIGSVNDIRLLRRLINRSGSPALLHTDAVQAFGKINIRPASTGADLVSVSSHKIHGPKGAGALYIKSGIKIQPYILGGGQENGLVSGTEPLPSIAGFAAACSALGDIQKKYERVSALRDGFVSGLGGIPGVFVNSPADALPYIVNISVPGIPSEVLVNFMSEREIYISAGSACKRGHRSDVLSQIGLPPERIDSAVRISMSADTTAEELGIFTENLKEAIARFVR